MTDVAESTDHAEVAARTRRGVSWNLLGAVITNVVRLLSVVLLGRLLTAHDFGVVVAATSVLMVLHTVRDVGVGPALVQRADLTAAHRATALATSVGLGVIITAALVLTAPWIGALYGIPASVPIIQALGVIFLLRGVTTVPQHLAHRAMNFRAVALVDTVSYAAGVATAIPLALDGAGPWALVGGYLVEETLALVIYVAMYPPSLRGGVDRTSLRDLLRFGGGQTVSQIAGVVATQGDNMIVGNQLGEVELGLYTRAYDLIKMPALLFTTVVGNVLFPAFSRLQDQPERLAEGLRRVTFANAMVLVPASATLAVAAPEVIGLLVGPQWSSSVLPFQILSASMFFRSTYKVGAMLAAAVGWVNLVALIQVAYMVTVLIGALLAVDHGIPAVAGTTAAAIALVYAACAALGARAARLPLPGLLAVHGPGVLTGAVAGGAAWLIAGPARAHLGSPALVLLAIVGAGVLAAVAVLVLGLRSGRSEFPWLGQELQRLRRRGRRGART